MLKSYLFQVCDTAREYRQDFCSRCAAALRKDRLKEQKRRGLKGGAFYVLGDACDDFCHVCGQTDKRA